MQDESAFHEALGVYVGPAEYQEVVEALMSAPPTSDWIVHIERHAFGDCPEEVAWRFGHLERYTAYDEDARALDLFLLIGGERGGEALRAGVMWRDPVFAFYLSESLSDRFEAERYSGGVKLHLALGLFTLTFAVWHSILHETPGGDVAPGFGPLEVELEEREDQA